VKFDVVTIFPEFFSGPLDASLLGKARGRGLIEVTLHDLRDHTHDVHRSVDDEPYGGGVGMVMKPEPWYAAVESIEGGMQARRILLSPAGRRLDQQLVAELAEEAHLVLMCGRYEGVDERVAIGLATDEVSIGDYVIAGGEAAALVLIDAVARLIPGVVKEPASVEEESFGPSGLLDYPHYTRPPDFRGMRVPDVLLSGNHADIASWRRTEALERTKRRRPDLLGPDLDLAP
jgi:tRNA (guanine37-N1)-methyltransferase